MLIRQGSDMGASKRLLSDWVQDPSNNNPSKTAPEMYPRAMWVLRMQGICPPGKYAPSRAQPGRRSRSAHLLHKQVPLPLHHRPLTAGHQAVPLHVALLSRARLLYRRHQNLVVPCLHPPAPHDDDKCSRHPRCGPRQLNARFVLSRVMQAQAAHLPPRPRAPPWSYLGPCCSASGSCTATPSACPPAAIRPPTRCCRRRCCWMLWASLAPDFSPPPSRTARAPPRTTTLRAERRHTATELRREQKAHRPGLRDHANHTSE